MATYVNDLRLKEIGTGESSGTWGSETNTNLELIGEALGFGTEAITTNADTHTTTVADGSTDPGRAMYLKYTGTLDSACTITIAPNTMSRMHFIENGTSGSQNIIISQGTGANVTIPAGDVKAVYLDGAGSGAAVVDAFASLNVVDLKVEDDLTVTDDATIGGTLGVTGAVTANAGVNIDNISIDGTTIALSSGNLTLDVAGNLILDADGGEFQFHDGGTNILEIANSSSDVIIRPAVQDKDLKFNGNDGGAAITALTLDMSNAGAANFNAGISIGGTEVINSSRNLVNITNLVVDELDIGGDTITASDDFIVDAATDIILDADGSTITMKDGGTTRITFNLDATPDLVMAGGNASITASTSDADLSFIGNDGGSDVTALTLDMSQAGRATFNEGIVCKSSTGGDFGVNINTASGDSMTMQVVDTGTGGAANGVITVSDGDLILSPSANVGIRETSPANNLHIGIDNGGEGILVKSTGDHSGLLQFNVNRSNSNRVLGQLLGTWNGTDVCDIQLKTADDTTNKDNGQITFSTSTANNLSEKMRLNDQGKLGVGTTTPQSGIHIAEGGAGNDGGSVLTLSQTGFGSIVNNDDLGSVHFGGVTSGGVGIHNAAKIMVEGDGTWASNDYPTRMVFFTTTDGASSATEKVRLDNAGNFMVGLTTTSGISTSSGAGNEGAFIQQDGAAVFSRSNEKVLFLNRKTTNGIITSFRFNGSDVGTISTNANSLPSDRNFKRDIEDLNIGLDLVTKLNPVSYNYKIDNEGTPKMFGLIAQDLEQSLEEVGVDKNSVQLLQHEPNDDEKQSDYSLDYLKFTPILIKAIQEQQEQIDALQSEINILKGE